MQHAASRFTFKQRRAFIPWKNVFFFVVVRLGTSRNEISNIFCLSRNGWERNSKLFYRLRNGLERNSERFPFHETGGIPTEWIQISACSMFPRKIFSYENGNPSPYATLPTWNKLECQRLFSLRAFKHWCHLNKGKSQSHVILIFQLYIWYFQYYFLPSSGSVRSH